MIGQTILQYTVLEKIGEGGMGVVYKAHDGRLDRFVALKFLPPHMAASEQDKARFIQEAKSASALNHPNVCTIHDIAEHDGTMFIVMEFVDGQTLRDKKGTIGYKQAIDIGIQIAEGLSAAHEKGIIHRDIKPDNIMLRKDGIAQIMDFGLAKLNGVSRLTKAGSTVGTAGYMSPEQVQGMDSDHRSDIFSFGVLMFELLTGQLPFSGVHETALAYEIVNVDSPPMSSIKSEIAPELDAVILECLEKDPRERAQSMKQIAVDLHRYRRESSRQRASRITSVRSIPSSAGRRSFSASGGNEEASNRSRQLFPRWTIYAAAAILMGAAGFAASYFSTSKIPDAPVIVAAINMPAGLYYNDKVGGQSAISPDGSTIVFLANDSLSRSLLWVRSLSSGFAKSLPGTENAQYPFWSYDSRSIGFFADGKVKSVDVRGGPVFVLADAPFGRGGTWSSSGSIIYSPSVTDVNLYAVPSEGGTPQKVTRLDSTSNAAPRFPFALPDGDHFLFSLLSLGEAGSNRSDIYVGSLNNGDATKLLNDASYGVYASGYVLSLRQNILVAQQFDLGSLAFGGKPVPIVDNINAWSPRAKADFSASTNGLLLYAKGQQFQGSEVLWVDRDGSFQVIGELSPFVKAALSPDDTKIVYDKVGQSNNDGASIWIYDIVNKVDSRLTFGGSSSIPVWSKDGKKIYYNTESGGSKANIYVKQADGSGEEQLVVKGEPGSKVQYRVEDVSPDGNTLLLRIGNESGARLSTFDVRSSTLTDLGIAGTNSKFSPDGKWIVYLSNETEGSRLFLVSFNGIAGKWQLPSESSFGDPLWSGGQIIYYSRTREYYETCAVSFANGRPQFGFPKPLFRDSRTSNVFLYNVSKDGKKYLALRAINGGMGSSLALIVNWQKKVEFEKRD